MIQAFRTGLTDTLKFSGRMPRKPFWAFAPVWAVLCVAVLVILRTNFSEHDAGLLILVATSALALPFWSAVWRRYQDVGVAGVFGLYPLVPIVSAASCLYIIVTNVAGPAHISQDPVSMLFIVSSVAAAPAFCLRLFAIQGFGERLGIMLVSSEPGSNRYGPNPSEVSQ